MEAAIVIIAIIVAGAAAIGWERQYSGNDTVRTYQVSRGAYSMSVVFAFTWVLGYLFALPLVADFGIAAAVVTAAVYYDTSRRLAKKK